MKKEKSFRIFVIYALLLQFAILLSQQSFLKDSASTTIPNYTTRDATVQIMVSYIDPENPSSQEFAYTGTGAIIADQRGNVYALTAKHVCSPNPYYAMIQGLSEEIEVQDASGEYHSAEIALTSSSDDLCIIKYKSTTSHVSVAEFAKNPAGIDAPVSMYAAPGGFYVPSALTKFTGVFSGESMVWGEHVAIYTLPATGGASGAAITNNKGEIVGVLHSVLSDFHHISLATTYESTIEFIEQLQLREGIIVLD